MPVESVPAAAVAPLRFESLPGPRRVPLLGNAHQIQAEAFHQQLEAWAQEYGGRYRFQITHRHFIAITDPEAIASVLKRLPGCVGVRVLLG